ncbi:MAG: DUF262 domain-containing protein [Candidatus Kapaibacteriota bacterium]
MKGIQDTSNMTYRQLMGNGLRYEIPKFQRDYSWENEQWDDLWQDIMMLVSNEETEHYMGYLVLQTIDNKNFIIIDGQQRLTTLSILVLAVLKCLNDLIARGVDSTNNELRRDTLRNSYIGFIDPVTLIANNKLKLNRNSDEYYRRHIVLLEELRPLRNANTSEKQMRECFLWLYDNINKVFSTGEELAGFIDSIVDKLSFTVIKVTDQLNAFTVFETLNSRGMQLSSSDLLKNYLFSVVDESPQKGRQEIEELEDIWMKLVGTLGSQSFEEYLRYYWNSFNRTVRKNHLFKTIKKQITGRQQVFALTRELQDHADVYLALQSAEDELWKGQPKIQQALHEINLFHIKQTNSLLLSGYKYLSLEKFTSLVQCCAVISFRYNIISGRNPNEQEDVYNAIARKIAAEKTFDKVDFQSVYIPDANFESNFLSKQFKNRNHKIVKYILVKIEEYKYGHILDAESSKITIEHILPENAHEEWGDFSSEEMNRSVYRLGNLTLLEKNRNKDADIRPYLEKKELYAQSSVRMTQAIAEHYDIWNEHTISERQKYLAQDAKAIWKIQW